MIDLKDTPESAFPSTFKSLAPDATHVHRWGMTLRDYFAAKAMQELVGVLAPSDCARKAYQYASEMMKARES